MPRKKLPPPDRTQQIVDGEWMKYTGTYYHVCCDCGLSHYFELKLEDGKLWERWTVDAKETKRQRRINGKTV